VLDSPSVHSLQEWTEEKAKFRNQLQELIKYLQDHDGAYPKQNSTCPVENKLASRVNDWRRDRNTMKSWKKDALDAAGFVWSVGTGSGTTTSDAIRLEEYWNEKAEIKSHGVRFTKKCRDCSKETQLLISQAYNKQANRGNKVFKRSLRCCSKEKDKSGKPKANSNWDFVGTEAEFKRMEDIILGRKRKL
jgi:hypothetical protein